jgi:hypothetical protein
MKNWGGDAKTKSTRERLGSDQVQHAIVPIGGLIARVYVKGLFFERHHAKWRFG